MPASVRAEVSEPFRSASLPDGVGVKILIFEPNLESALGLGRSPNDRMRGQRLRETIQHLDLQDAADQSVELHRLLTLLGWTP